MPSVPGMLTVWEHGLQQAPVERALSLLQATAPDRTAEELAGLSIGQRDAALLTLREWAFGSRIASVAGCPECGQSLEINLDIADLRRIVPDEESPEQSLTVDAYDVRFRLPNSADLTCASGSTPVIAPSCSASV